MHWKCCIQATCYTVVCCNSVVLCNSDSADRSGMASSSFLAAAAACVILLCFAAEGRKSHYTCGVKVANAALAADCFHLGTVLLIFFFKFLLQSAKSSFFRFDVEIRFWSCK